MLPKDIIRFGLGRTAEATGGHEGQQQMAARGDADCSCKASDRINPDCLDSDVSKQAAGGDETIEASFVCTPLK